jgi:hypothetical protein
VFWWVPIARGVDRDAERSCLVDPPVQNGYDLIAFTDCQSPTRTKVILHIDNQQSIACSHAPILTDKRRQL